jgi:hypothetical protein
MYTNHIEDRGDRKVGGVGNFLGLCSTDWVLEILEQAIAIAPNFPSDHILGKIHIALPKTQEFLAKPRWISARSICEKA